MCGVVMKAQGILTLEVFCPCHFRVDGCPGPFLRFFVLWLRDSGRTQLWAGVPPHAPVQRLGCIEMHAECVVPWDAVLLGGIVLLRSAVVQFLCCQDPALLQPMAGSLLLGCKRLLLNHLSYFFNNNCDHGPVSKTPAAPWVQMGTWFGKAWSARCSWCVFIAGAIAPYHPVPSACVLFITNLVSARLVCARTQASVGLVTAIWK
mmetsp:Transcript_86615/g.144060  ORF Transcript_86615/g.144060 Transcript_86615/m.144060 type:complete len:205 (+) Transcript_86615:127-741(+)